MNRKLLHRSFLAAVVAAGLFSLFGSQQSVGGELAAEGAELKRLIEQLDAPAFREREQAQQALIQLPGLWVERLKESRRKTTSPEVRGRLDQVIRQRSSGAWKTDMKAALAAAKNDDKLVMVFSTRGPVDGFSCMGANLMRHATFADEQLQQNLRLQVVAVWHNQNGAIAAAGLGVKCVEPANQTPPTKEMAKAYPVGGGGGNLRTYFCTPTGKIVHYVEGYWPAKQFTAEVRYAQERYQAMKLLPDEFAPKAISAKLAEEIAAIDKLRADLVKRHPEEFKKPFPKSEIRRLHASLGLKIKAYRDGTKLAGKEISPILAQLMVRQIDRGAFI